MKTPFSQKTSVSQEQKTSHVIRISSADEPKHKEPVALEPPEEYGQLPLDIFENGKEILILSPIAGVDLEKTEIVINEDILTIQGTRQMENEAALMRGFRPYLQECFWGEFSRSVILPMHADTQGIEATQKDHILQIRIPKRQNIQMRIVKIKNP